MPDLNTQKNRVKYWRDFALDLMFPIECLGCGQEGDWLCQNCHPALKINHSLYCLDCKTKNKFGEFCPACKNNFHLNGIWIAGDYQNKILAKAIKVFKYRFSQDLSLLLGNFLSIFLNNLAVKHRLSPSDIDVSLNRKKFEIAKSVPGVFLDFKNSLIMPIPLHKRRRRWRGFNQSELLAKIIGKNFDLEFSEDLKRIKYTTPQAKLDRKQRKTNIKNCFVWTGKNLKNKNIILVDDVTTTGSTLNECARVLRANGAREIWGLVIANG